MIVHSTPSTIVWADDLNRRLDFHGEWTLEPKFYLTIPKKPFWYKGTKKTEMTNSEFKHVLDKLLIEAVARGWNIEVDTANS
jgi:hypothetical protein